MNSLINSCYVNQICDLFRCRHVAALASAGCGSRTTVPPRCRQMVDPAPSLPDDFHPHYGSTMVTRNSQAQHRHQEPASAAFSLFHPKNRKRSKIYFAELHRGKVFLLTGGVSPQNWGNSRETCTTVWARHALLFRDRPQKVASTSPLM